MQCMNCGFENIPGMQACVRCQSLLNLSAVAVAPPRAGRLRAGTRVAGAWNRTWAALNRPLWPSSTWARPDFPFAAVGEAIARSLIPGLGLRMPGARRTGRWLFWTWAGLLAAALIGPGTEWSSWAFNAAVAVHALAAIALTAATLTFEGLLGRSLHGLLVFLMLRFMLYSPAAWFGRQFLVPMAVTALDSNPVVNSGDGLLYAGPWLRPTGFQRGDLVVYRLDRAPGASHNYARIDGFGLDRIVALPGDSVQVLDGVLRVNGHPPAAQHSPISSPNHLGNFELQLGPGLYGILPSALPLRVYGVRPDALIRGLSVVPQEDVLGRVIWRMHPWSHFGGVE